MDAVLQWVAVYGYAAVFFLLMLGVVGLPVPDETLLVFCGYLVSKGTFRPAGAFAAALAGSWCGISLSYMIGRTVGLGMVHRFGKYIHVTDQRLETVHRWFGKSGHWALFGGYYIAGVRHLTAILAGASKLEFRTFVLFAWSGGMCWVASFLTLGYFLGEDWKRAADVVHRDLVAVSVALIILGLAYYVWRRTVAGPRNPV